MRVYLSQYFRGQIDWDYYYVLLRQSNIKLEDITWTQLHKFIFSIAYIKGELEEKEKLIRNSNIDKEEGPQSSLLYRDIIRYINKN